MFSLSLTYSINLELARDMIRIVYRIDMAYRGQRTTIRKKFLNSINLLILRFIIIIPLFITIIYSFKINNMH